MTARAVGPVRGEVERYGDSLAPAVQQPETGTVAAIAVGLFGQGIQPQHFDQLRVLHPAHLDAVLELEIHSLRGTPRIVLVVPDLADVVQFPAPVIAPVPFPGVEGLFLRAFVGQHVFAELLEAEMPQVIQRPPQPERVVDIPDQVIGPDHPDIVGQFELPPESGSYCVRFFEQFVALGRA